jgi:hypothetical protein
MVARLHRTAVPTTGDTGGEGVVMIVVVDREVIVVVLVRTVEVTTEVVKVVSEVGEVSV